MNDTLLVVASWAQILSIPLTLLAITVSIWLYRRSTQKRELSCVLTEPTSLIEFKIGESVMGDIEVRYKNRKVKNLFIVRTLIQNSGNLPISASTVIEPLKFSFPPGTELVKHPSVLNVTPKNLHVNWRFGSNETPEKIDTVFMEFNLVNPKDKLTLEFLCAGEPQLPQVSARIEGMPEIKTMHISEVRKKAQRKFFLFYGSSIVILVLLVLLIISLMPQIVLEGIRYILLSTSVFLINLDLPFFVVILVLFVITVRRYVLLWKKDITQFVDSWIRF